MSDLIIDGRNVAIGILLVISVVAFTSYAITFALQVTGNVPQRFKKEVTGLFIFVGICIAFYFGFVF
ncbi:MAG: hypothetical protein AAGJ37_07245 [Pseudomonadota bacterium]